MINRITLFMSPFMATIEMRLKSLLLTFFLVTLTACGGGGSAVEEEVPVAQAVSCETSDDGTIEDGCGILLLGLTDADGDFLNYTVDVTGIELTRLDGTQVSAMPSTQSVNFVDYVELSELTTAATIPAGIYTAGSITIDYTNADIQVEKEGEAVAADMVDEVGEPLLSQTLQLQLDEDNQLVIARNRPALLELDFNLAASHTVNLETEPVTVTTEPYVIAEVDPIQSKEFRIRGPLIRVNEDESYFRVAVRPYYRHDGRFGGVNVQVEDETNFEINGEAFSGAEGLTQMATLEAGTPTVTLGLFDRAADSFTAITVMAGSSVPGSDKDAARGVIVARDGNNLTVRGASLIRDDGIVTFRDEITVLIAETTKVSKPRRIQDEVTIADLSVGQAVTVLGTITTDESDGTVIDATEGGIRMRLTFASGHTLSKDDVLLTMDLQQLQGRLPDVYDFSGTGMDETFDASPDAYEVSIENLMVTNLDDGDPVRVSGFVSPFGAAPPDFEALTVINYAESRSQLYVNWPDGDDVTAFSEITTESLTINIVNGGEDGIYKLIQGGIRTDLTSFDEAVVIQPKGERGIYTLRSNDTIMAFSDFADFVAELQQKLDEGNLIDGMHATGGFSTESKTFSALKIAIRLN
ncbi:hypothetical protein [Aliikangiella coralliicola]|uniref:DUF4382 domain-containing protein n=1 Tax=Aliikangiella coralliicola TaxID=2592383 RepID=A0A545U624_9GAMM|nr:hypothetical protein [Aliikangiella coralliicola]TQV84922.1 hypothetical protein FLL46_21240 [Aliikangiella coralliicola]